MTGFISELKRRNVIRMAGLYIVGAWLILQVSETLLPIFDTPGWVLKALVYVLAIGFLPVLAFSWIYELTPEGLKRDSEVQPGQSIAPQTAHRMERVIIVLFAIALLFFAFDRFILAPKREAGMVAEAIQSVSSENRTGATVSAKSIAVLPFVNMSADKDQEYFSDGMTEELLNALAKVPRLAVTARTSVFSLKGQNKDIRDIGKLLGVTYVLEGSVRKAGDEVRITAQLIRADNGFHLWSETYDRKLENIFDMQAEIASAIAKALELPLGIGGDVALVSERSDDQQAYAMYLQARAAYRARGDGVKKSIELYREAIKRDPKFAPAWAGLASSLAVLPWYVSDAERANTPAFMKDAEQAGNQALLLAPDLPQGHTALAMVYTFEWQWALAEKHFKRALILAPNDPEVYYHYSDWLAGMGRLEESLKSASKAVELDPLVPIFLNGKANNLQRLERHEESIPVRQAAYALAPEVRLFRTNLLRAYIETKRLDDAENQLDRDRASTLARAQRNGFKGDPQRIPRAAISLMRNPSLAVSIRKEIGDKDFNAVQGLIGGSIDERMKSLDERMDEHFSGVDPVAELRSMRYADYRKDPRYIKLLNKAGFDDEGNIR